jgi:glycosyltransferase involved in cell wall biosynthesis
MNEPLISVVMPVFDGARYLAEAIESVLALSDCPLELIVVDDGSTDDSAAIVRRYNSPVRLFAQAHAGCGSARNRGAGAARGAFLAFFDADDLLPPNRLQRQLAEFASDPGLDGVFGELEEFVSPDLDERVAGLLRAPTPRRSVRMMMTMLLRTESFWRVGPFATDLGRGVDLDWLARADDLDLRMVPCDSVVTYRRLHDASTGFRRRGDEDDYVRATRLAIARRRQPS